VEKQTVVVWGSSLNMAGIAASLQADERLEVVRLNPHFAGDQAALRELRPEAIAFDLSDPTSALDHLLLSDLPQGSLPLLIGVDPNSNEMLVLSGQAKQALRAADLVHVICSKKTECEPLERRES
jgi:hypothetical protein